jgi:exosortase/archaeosortase family protein
MLKFFIFYILNMIVLFLLFTYQKYIDLQLMYTEVINPIVTFFINSIGINAIYIGIDIFLPTSTLKVLFGCNGLEAILIFTAGILAFKADLKYKLKYLLQGILFISTVNIFRLVILAYVLEVHSNYFSLMHDYVTQHIMIFLAILLFLIFTSNVKEINKGK